MTIATRNPEYVCHEQDWELCRDCYAGERAVKDKGIRYLPATGGMYIDGFPGDGQKGTLDYVSYRKRAVFRNFFKRSVLHYMGQLWHKEPTIELPKRMEPMMEKCTRQNEGLLQLLRSMHEEILVTGRLGLYGEMPKGKTTDDVLPYISMYTAENIINWDEGDREEVSFDSLNMVVLNESGPRRVNIFNFERVDEFRLLLLGDPTVNEQNSETITNNGGKGPLFSVGIFAGESEFDPDAMVIPTIRGVALGVLPFVFINSKHVQAKPDDPPQLDLANQDVTIYRGEADYRQCLHQQAQPTLVKIGCDPLPVGEDATRLGVGAVINITNPAGDAKFIGPDPTGLPEIRSSLENDIRQAEVMSGSLTDTRSNDKESGDAMGQRMAAESCKLVNIAQNAAAGLQALLRILATWLGENPDEVVVTANTEFSNKPLLPADLLQLQQFKTAGGPISDESIHMNVTRSGLSDMTYEDEQGKIDEETPRIDLSGAPLGAPLNPLQDQQMQHADEHLKMDKQAAKDQKAADKAAAKKPGAKK